MIKLSFSHSLKLFLFVLAAFVVVSRCNFELNSDKTSHSGVVNNETHSNYDTFSLSIEEQEAVIVERVLIHSTKFLQTSIRVLSTAIRISADTVSGLIGGIAKGFGGILNVFASILWWTSDYIQWSNESVVQFKRMLNSTASLMSGAGDSCVWGGEIVEALSSGMGQAIQDSFRGLESVPRAIEYLVNFAFHPQFRPLDGHEPVRQTNGSDKTGTSRDFDAIIQQQNALYRSRYRYSDQFQQENNSFVHDGDVSGETRSTSDLVRRSSSSHISLLRRNHTTPGRKSETAGLDVRSKFKEASDLFKVPGSPCGERAGDDCSETKTQGAWPHLVSLFYVRQRTVSAYQACMRCLTELAASLTLSGEELPAGPSIGPFLLLGLLMVSIVNLCEYSSVRKRFAVLLLCSLIVWVWVVRIEQEQRLRLVKRTTVQSLYSYLDQQTVDRSLNGTAVAHNSTAPYEHAVWLNVFLGALWTVDSAGGAGAFLNKVFEDAVSAELAQVPPSVASVRLKRFDLGSSAPLVRGIRVASVSDAKCVADALAFRRSVHATKAEINQHAAARGTLSSESVLDFIYNLVSIAGQRLRPSASASRQAGGGGASRFLSACGEVVLEMDFVFASRDMLVELSLRSADSQSVLPDLASATLSEVLLAGQLRLAIQLTEDYPFMGNATASFLEPPTVDFTVSSFGGVDLSAIPLAFHWMNGTIHWLLEQYTHPLSMPVDLRHMICPDCDVSAALTPAEVLVETSHRIRRAAVRVAAAVEGILTRESTTAMRLLARLKVAWLGALKAIRQSVDKMPISSALRHFQHRYKSVERRMLDFIDLDNRRAVFSTDAPETAYHTPPPLPPPPRSVVPDRWYALLARRVLGVEDWSPRDFEETFVH